VSPANKGATEREREREGERESMNELATKVTATVPRQRRAHDCKYESDEDDVKPDRTKSG